MRMRDIGQLLNYTRHLAMRNTAESLKKELPGKSITAMAGELWAVMVILHISPLPILYLRN